MILKNLLKKRLLKPIVKAGDIVSWLKEDFGLGHGHAMAIYAVLKSSAQPEATKEESLDKHFSRAKSSSRGTFDNLVK